MMSERFTPPSQNSRNSTNSSTGAPHPMSTPQDFLASTQGHSGDADEQYMEVSTRSEESLLSSRSMSTCGRPSAEGGYKANGNPKPRGQHHTWKYKIRARSMQQFAASFSRGV